MNIFKTKRGEVVIFQSPNTPLKFFIGFFLISLIPGLIGVMGYWAATVSLTYWAYLEVTSGVNLFRKLLGIGVIIYLVFTRLYPVL